MPSQMPGCAVRRMPAPAGRAVAGDGCGDNRAGCVVSFEAQVHAVEQLDTQCTQVDVVFEVFGGDFFNVVRTVDAVVLDDLGCVSFGTLSLDFLSFSGFFGRLDCLFGLCLFNLGGALLYQIRTWYSYFHRTQGAGVSSLSRATIAVRAD